MNRVDLHDKFIEALYNISPVRSNLVNQVADTLLIEKDAAYRRVTGKVAFSIREMGILARRFKISLDRLMHVNQDYTWLPFILNQPLKVASMETLYDIIDSHIKIMADISEGAAESGNIYSTIPMEYYLHSPLLTKFMFFKWGHYFIGTEEFYNFSGWKLSERVHGIAEKLKTIRKIDKTYYIWDESLIWNTSREIESLYKMRIITSDERKEILNALKDMLTRLEHTLNGMHDNSIFINPEAEFYASSMHLGFTCNYFSSPKTCFSTLQTNFSFSLVPDNRENFNTLKEWIDSFKSISTLLSRSGRIERRLFFEEQHRLLQ